MLNNTNTDITKLKFLSGTLRADKQGTYDYMGLFKQALAQLGITYPSGGGGTTYTFDNGLTKNLSNNVQLGGLFTAETTTLGDYGTPYLEFYNGTTDNYTSLENVSPNTTHAAYIYSGAEDDVYSTVTLTSRNSSASKSSNIELYTSNEVVGTTSQFFNLYTRQEDVSGANSVQLYGISRTVGGVDSREMYFLSESGANISKIIIPDVTNTGAGNYYMPLSVRNNYADQYGEIYFPMSNIFTPTSSADASGVQGDITYDNSFIYVKAAGGWRRAALSTF